MVAHRHWNAPAQTETAVVAEHAPVAVTPTPTITHVWAFIYRESSYDDTEVKLFSSKELAEDAKLQYAMDNGDGPREADEDDEDSEDEDTSDYVDRFYEDFSCCEITRMKING